MVDMPVAAPAAPVPPAATAAAPVAPIVLPSVAQLEAQAKVDGVAVLKFFGGLVGSGLLSLGGLVVGQITFTRIVVVGGILWVVFGGFFNSERFSKVTGEVTTVSTELVAIEGELKGVNARLDAIQKAIGGAQADVPAPTGKKSRY